MTSQKMEVSKRENMQRRRSCASRSFRVCVEPGTNSTHESAGCPVFFLLNIFEKRSRVCVIQSKERHHDDRLVAQTNDIL